MTLSDFASRPWTADGRLRYDLPEWSHVSRASAERYTATLYRIIEADHPPPGDWRW